MGKVLKVAIDSIVLLPNETDKISPLKPGDGLVFDAANWRTPEAHEEGGRVYQVKPLKGGQLELHFGNGAISF